MYLYSKNGWVFWEIGKMKHLLQFFVSCIYFLLFCSFRIFSSYWVWPVRLRFVSSTPRGGTWGVSGSYIENDSGQHIWSLPCCLRAKITFIDFDKRVDTLYQLSRAHFSPYLSNSLYFSSVSQKYFSLPVLCFNQKYFSLPVYTFPVSARSILPCLSYASIISESFKILLNLFSSRICMKYLDVKQC